MKKQFHLILLTLLTAIVCSCGNSNSSNGQNQSLIASVTHECFMKRFNDFEQKYPDKKGLLQGYYAASQHSLDEFMKRFNDFEQKYPDKKGLLQGYYAQSENTICE